ncbi:MAG: PD40 domain-containing protein [Candidatus Krumholzibacteriota bacterium]|nr:PD40 domain-containing protein [Candidatus Krumholzibacteriota bacterium]
MKLKSFAAVWALVLAAGLALDGCGEESSPVGNGGGGGSTIDTIPPAVHITSPLDGSALPAQLDIACTVTDDTEIDVVYFELTDLCGTALWSANDLSAPYEAECDASNLGDGVYRICAAAYDTAGNFSDWFCVTVAKGTSSAAITGFFPLAAYRGREITVQGSGFGTVTGKVAVSGQDAVVNDWSDTEVTFVMPVQIPEDAIISMELVVECRWRLQHSIEVTSPGVIRITDHAAEERWPCWSADGNWIYFSSVRSGNWDIWRISLDGTQLQQVTFDEGFDAMPSVRPSSGELAWVSNRNHLGNNSDLDYEIFTGFTGAGGGIVSTVMFTSDNDNNNSPAWSPQVYSGYSLLYTQFYDPEDDGTTIPIIYMYSSGGTDSIGAGMCGCFSSNGRWVVYQDNDYQIRKKEIETTTPIILTDGSSHFRPNWGWANNRIVFSKYKDGYEQLFVMEADGSNQQPLIDRRWLQTEPRWSSDCSKIVFTGHRFGNFDIYVYEVP